jgi:tetratricopeptide (TPR) repeat protein
MNPQPGSLASTLSRALAALRNGDLDTADAICRELLLSAPDHPAAHQLSAAIALGRGDGTGAVRAASASLARRPDHVPTLIIAGRGARSSGNPRLAISFFRRAVELDRDRAEPAFLMCVTLLEVGDSEATALLPTLLERFPADADGWRVLGDALYSANKLEAALIAFARAATVAPSAALHLRRGTILRSLGRIIEAVEAFRTAATLAPDRAADRAEAWFALGVIEQDRGNFAEAAALYDRALTAQPELAEAAVNLGICRQNTGDLPGAKEAYRTALRLRSDTFGRIAQALAASPVGEVWLDHKALRRSLVA